MAAAGAVLVVLGVIGLVVGSGSQYRRNTQVGASGTDLYFTTYSPETVRRVSYSVVRGQLSLGGQSVIARPPGADGAIFSPTGALLVGGGNGFVYSVNTSDGSVTPVRAGAPAFMLSVSTDGRKIYTAGLPGPLAVLQTDPLTPGHPIPLTGDDTAITALAFAPKGTVLYTSSDPSGTGDIGTIDLITGRTHRLFRNVPGAHGALYDPYSADFITMGGSTILQLSAADPSQVVSEARLTVTRIDQGAVDGRGRLFAASNNGDLTLVDYSTTRRVGSLSDRVSTAFLAPSLDDVAPLIGAGSAPSATLARWWRAGGIGSLVLAGLVLLVPATTAALRAARQRRPTWDRRRGRGRVSGR